MKIIKSATSILLLICSFQTQAVDTARHCQHLFDDAEYTKAIDACQQAAELGNAASQTVLGEMIDAGNGTEIDQKLVHHWWTKASNSGYLPAQNLLALKYYYGGSVFEKQPEWQQDYKKAFDIWQQSAINGVATSQYMVGEMYLHGQGVEQDYSESYAWFKIALEGGYKLATDSLIELSRVISVDQKRAGIVRLDELKKLNNGTAKH